MSKILLVGTAFPRNGEGVSDMNYTFKKYLSKEISLDSIDIYELSGSQFSRLNRMLARNLFLLETKQMIEKKFSNVLHPNDLCNTLPVINLSKYSQKRIITIHDFSLPPYTILISLDGYRYLTPPPHRDKEDERKCLIKRRKNFPKLEDSDHYVHR